MKIYRSTQPLIILTACLLCAYLFGQQPPTPPLPENIRATLARQYPDATIQQLEHDTIVIAVYEAELQLPDGQEVSVQIAPDGTLLSWERPVEKHQIPFDITSLLPENATQVTELEQEITLASFVPIALEQPVITYEMEVLINGKQVEYTLSPQGVILRQDIEDDDDDEDEEGGATYEDDEGQGGQRYYKDGYDDDDERQGDDDDRGDDDDENDDDDGEDEVELSRNSIPQEVRETILREARGARIREVELERVRGKYYYEAEFVRNGVEIEIRVAPDGRLVGRRVEGPNDDDD